MKENTVEILFKTIKEQSLSIGQEIETIKQLEKMFIEEYKNKAEELLNQSNELVKAAEMLRK